MPSVITHAVVGFALAARARGFRDLNRKAILWVCAVLAMLPDADTIGFHLSVQYNSLFGHRGFTHSLFFAALEALAAAWLLQRRRAGGWPAFGRVFLLVFLAVASHGFFDAMTDGGEGVAFFAPFSNHRYFFFYRPIMVSPIGVGAFLGWRGALILADEFLIVVLPLTAVLFSPELLARAKKNRVVAVLVIVAWLFLLAALNGLSPIHNLTLPRGGGHRVIDLYAKQYRTLQLLQLIPATGIPDGKLVTNFAQFQKLGLYNRRLEAKDAAGHWASGFFPNWFGGIAGRWQDSNVSLLFRTFFGYGVPSSPEIQEILREAPFSPVKKEFLFRLSPTEKYDLALGDYNFTATKSILAITHNASELPKFWYGICNGMAAASKWYEEPFRAVDVVNPNGFRIRFHPNDVKALMGYAMANAQLWTEVGTRCNVNGPEARNCRVNPGAFFLAFFYRLGLAHDSFIVDGFSGTRKQFYLFDAVRVEVLGDPRPVDPALDGEVPTPVKSVAKVRFTMDLVSTLLSDKNAGVEEDTARGEGFYRKVGRIVVPRVLDAELALARDGEVIGGAWLGDEDVPDLVFFSSDTPAVDNADRLKLNGAFSWTVIKGIYLQSVLPGPKPGGIDFSL